VIKKSKRYIDELLRIVYLGARFSYYSKNRKVVLGASTWNEWRNNMISRHENPTERNLNELFANWY